MIVHVFALLCCCTVEFLHRGLMCLAWMLCHPLGYLWVKLSPDLSAMQTWFSPTLGFWRTAFYKMFGHLLNSNECCRFLTILMLPWISLVVSLSLVFSPDIIWHLGHLQSHNFHQLPLATSSSSASTTSGTASGVGIEESWEEDQKIRGETGSEHVWSVGLIWADMGWWATIGYHRCPGWKLFLTHVPAAYAEVSAWQDWNFRPHQLRTPGPLGLKFEYVPMHLHWVLSTFVN